MDFTVPLSDSWDRLSSSNDGSKDVAFHSNTERQRADIEEEKISRISRGGLS